MHQIVMINLEHCSDGNAARMLTIDEKYIEFKRSLQLLTEKPVLYIANTNEAETMENNNREHVRSLEEYALKESNVVISLCSSIEQEIALLREEERPIFLQEYGLSEPGLNKVIRSSFELLGLHNFFTCGEKEVKSWTISKGSTAPQAAGNIHSDFERGFIKADTFHYSELIENGSEKALKELGLIRQEGKDYIVKDGDCIFFKFNV